jgi:hypothetical protein
MYQPDLYNELHAARTARLTRPARPRPVDRTPPAQWRPGSPRLVGVARVSSSRSHTLGVR